MSQTSFEVDPAAQEQPGAQPPVRRAYTDEEAVASLGVLYTTLTEIEERVRSLYRQLNPVVGPIEEAMKNAGEDKEQCNALFDSFTAYEQQCVDVAMSLKGGGKLVRHRGVIKSLQKFYDRVKDVPRAKRMETLLELRLKEMLPEILPGSFDHAAVIMIKR